MQRLGFRKKMPLIHTGGKVSVNNINQIQVSFWSSPRRGVEQRIKIMFTSTYFSTSRLPIKRYHIAKDNQDQQRITKINIPRKCTQKENILSTINESINYVSIPPNCVQLYKSSTSIPLHLYFKANYRFLFSKSRGSHIYTSL